MSRAQVPDLLPASRVANCWRSWGADVARTKSVDPFGPETDEEWHRLVMNDIHTKPFNFSGSPTLSVPCGFSAEGLPMSVQFVGRRLSETMLCRVGHAFERATQWHLRQPAV
jgi:Asp-tRNA(Asn)/Glu-tRNA(Gln) amidotransferase A subunit family amidase